GPRTPGGRMPRLGFRPPCENPGRIPENRSEFLRRPLREIFALFALKARAKPVFAEAIMSERDLFIAALKITEPAERNAWLDRECGDDVALRQRIDVLLHALDEAGSLLENPADAVEHTIEEPSTEATGTIIGPYKLLQQIGE